jgi:hypothetical protein
MTTEPNRPPESRSWREWLVLGVSALAAIILSGLAVPRMHVESDVSFADPVDFGDADDGARASVQGSVYENDSGFVVRPHGTGSVEIPVDIDTPEAGERRHLAITATGEPLAEVEVRAESADGIGRSLGMVDGWAARPFEVTELAGTASESIEVTVDNDSDQEFVFLDQVIVVTEGPDARPEGSRWLIAAWTLAVATTLLIALRQLPRHLPLALGCAVAAWLYWPDVTAGALEILNSEALVSWEAARESQLIDLHTGLVSGTFGASSPLTVQLFHLLTPITGDGLAAARTASMLLTIIALAAIYFAGNRVGGLKVAVPAFAVALLSDPLRDLATAGSPVPVILLAAALLVIAVHACLARARAFEMVLLGVAAALAVLADPIAWSGALLAVAIVGVLYGDRGRRLRLVGIGVLALTLVLLPGRISVADQHDGDALADVKQRVASARVAEYDLEVGSPDARETVGLWSYLEDHSSSVLVGGALAGLSDAISAAAEDQRGGVLAMLAFVLCLLGSVYVLLLPRLRSLVLLPLLVAAIPLFLGERSEALPFGSAAAFWPAFFVSAGVIVYAALRLAGVADEEPVQGKTRGVGS